MAEAATVEHALSYCCSPHCSPPVRLRLVEASAWRGAFEITKLAPRIRLRRSLHGRSSKEQGAQPISEIRAALPRAVAVGGEGLFIRVVIGDR